MSYDVLEDRMFKGLKKALSDNTNLPAFSEPDSTSRAEYIYITNEDMETIVTGNNGSNTFRGTFNIDYITNNKNKRTVRNNESKILETLADNNYFRASNTHYYFNGEVLNMERGEDEDDRYIFRIVYQISHTKVS